MYDDLWYESLDTGPTLTELFAAIDPPPLYSPTVDFGDDWA